MYFTNSESWRNRKYGTIKNNEIKWVTESLTSKKYPGLYGIIDEFHQIFKVELITTNFKLHPKIEKNFFQIHFMKSILFVIPKPSNYKTNQKSIKKSKTAAQYPW
jgi:hypothetical protein